MTEVHTLASTKDFSSPSDSSAGQCSSRRLKDCRDGRLFTFADDSTGNGRTSLLLLALEYAAATRGIRKINADLVRVLCQPNDELDELNVSSATLPAGDAVTAVATSAAALAPADQRVDGMYSANFYLPLVTALHVDTYLGPQQVLLLADLLEAHANTGDKHCNSSAIAFSFLPLLHELNLSGVCVDDDDSSGALFSQTTEAFLTLFAKLRGHPSLRTVRLQGDFVNPIIAASLQRLIRRTPTVTEVVFCNTSLLESEAASVEACCAINRLRQEQQKQAGPTVPRLTEEWQIELRDWLATKIAALCSWRMGRPSWPVPPLAEIGSRSTTSTPYVKRQQPLRLAKGTAPAATRSCGESTEEATGALSCSAHSPRSASTHPSVSASVCVPACSFGDGERSTETVAVDLPGEPASGSDSAAGFGSRRSAPCSAYLSYRQPADDPYTLTAACIDVVRCAFVEPSVARSTFLAGRPVPPVVPPPLLDAQAALSPLPRVARRKLAEEMANSALLRSVRQHLFPPPPVPQSVFGESTAHTQMRTTAEHEYYETLATQEKQWRLVVDRIVDYARPAYFSPDDAQESETVIYAKGDRPYWLHYVPTRSRVGDRGESKGLDASVSTVALLQPTSSDVSLRYTVPAGEFFGDAELLSGLAFYGQPLRAAGARRALHQGGGGPPVYAPLEERVTTAVVQWPQRPTHTLCVLLWRIPCEVISFYLSEPYQHFQRHVAAAGLARCTLPPTVSAAVACTLAPRSVSVPPKTASGVSTVTTALCEVVAQGDTLRRQLFLLAEGTYSLSTYTAVGKWVQRLLLPGSVVVGDAVFQAVEAIRQKHQLHGEHVKSTAEVAPHSSKAVLGREGALREYRKSVREKKLQTASAQVQNEVSVVPDQASAVASVPSPGDCKLCLARSAPASSAATTGLVYTIDMEQFTRFPEEVQLALTDRCVVA